MLTPQRKLWPGWLSPKSGDLKAKGGGSEDVGLSASEPRAPCLGSDKGREMGAGEEASMVTTAEVVTRLERELLEYQYNMGLLLIEKQEWSSKLEELTEALAEAKYALKREQTAYLVAFSDIEEREENLRKALGVEKQCVRDLEKALHEMRSEYAEIKFTSDSKLAEANALVASVEEKSLEVESKLLAADAKLAEVSRKNAEIERRLLEVDFREDALRKEYINFSNEREVLEKTLSNRKEDLKEWENKLHAGEDRLAEGRRILNQREERTNEKEKLLNQKECDLIEAQKNLDGVKVSLKAEEEAYKRRLMDLSSKEKELDVMRHGWEVKERDLLAFEEKLNHREKVKVQELTEEHSRLLNAKRCEFELEIEQKRQTIEEELKNKEMYLEKKEASISHLEEKIAIKELAIERRVEKLKEKEKEYESKFRALKDTEKTVKLEEKNVENEKEGLAAYKTELQSEKDELELKKAEVQVQQLKIHEDIEKLSVTEEERSELARLRAELKGEIAQCRLHKELVLKENEDLRQQRDIFERDWEELDKKKSAIETEISRLNEQREILEKVQYSEEEKIRKEKLASEEYIRKELAELENAKQSHATRLEHDKLETIEKIKNERTQMLLEFEMQQQEIENEIQRRHEVKENQLREKEKLFEENKERELNNLNYLRDVANREMEEMKLERTRLDREKLEVSENQKDLENNQLELRKDIDQLVSLSGKMKIQREEFVKERERFILFVQKHRNCETCGEITMEFVSSDLQHIPDGLNPSRLAGQKLQDAFTRREKADNSQVGVSGSPASGGTISWLQKCTSLIRQLSPIKTVEPLSQGTERVLNLVDNENKSGSVKNAGTETELGTSNSFVKHRMVTTELEDDNRTKNLEQTPPENSRYSNQTDALKPGKGQKPKVNRTRSVKAVVNDAKNFLGEDFEYSEKNIENSSLMASESPGESSLADRVPLRNGQKRNRKVASRISSIDIDDNDESEGHTNNLANRQKKRRQIAAPAVQAPGGNRYNLRRPRLASVSAKPTSENGNREAVNAGGEAGRMMKSKDAAVSSLGSVRDGGGSTPNVQIETTVNSMLGNEVEATFLSEECNTSAGDPEQSMQDELEYDTPNHSAVNNDSSSSSGEDDEEEESQHPGETSIGKKLWTFLTT